MPDSSTFASRLSTPAPLRVGLIGAGYFAGYHGEAWSRLASARLVAIADPVTERAQAFASRWGVSRVHASAVAMLDQEALDVVDITTRPESHRELTLLAAERGVQVICQKPLAPTWSDGVAMVEACERRGVRLLVHENWRWQAWYRQVRQLLVAGAVGSPFQVSFFWRTGDGVGPQPYALQPYFAEMPRLLVHETLVHLLDTFRFLAGEIATVFCRLQRVNKVLRGEDQATIVTTHSSGVLGLIDGNRLTGPVPPGDAMGSLWIEGDSGSLRMASDGRIWLRGLGATQEREHVYSLPALGYRGDSVHATQAHLIESLLTGRPAESEGRDYLRTVAAVDACYESARTRREITLGASAATV